MIVVVVGVGAIGICKGRGVLSERSSEELDAEIIERQRADAAQREMLTRRVAKAENRLADLDANFGE